MPRFFLPRVDTGSSFLALTGENAVHARVLRLKKGDAVTVCDGAGTEYQCTVSDISDGQVSLVVDAAGAAESEAGVLCTVYMALAKADKFEHVVQKATELGAAQLVCFPSERCVSRPDEHSLPKKIERWQKIAASAAEQSGRGRIPQVRYLPSYTAALQDAASAELAICFYENEHAHTFREAIADGAFHSAALLTGPEGGFTQAEVRQAAEAGLQICTLGRRILRCETAPLCALSALMYAVGEF